MAQLIEIRWHGRGGQGVVTAGKLLAEMALASGDHFQAFPDYGPERMGAPIRAFTRFSRQPITMHSQIEAPDIVVVLDPTLLKTVPVTEGLKENGTLLINASLPYPSHNPPPFRSVWLPTIVLPSRVGELWDTHTPPPSQSARLDVMVLPLIVAALCETHSPPPELAWLPAIVLPVKVALLCSRVNPPPTPALLSTIVFPSRVAPPYSK